MNKKFKKQYPKIVLLLIIACISLGYGALTSNLTIIGTSNINNASWDVHWNNVQITNGSVTGTNVTTAAHILTGNTEVEYSITLGTPGDFYEFTVDAVNAGSIDAMIGTFSNKVYQSNGTTERTLPDYLTYTVTYSDGVSLATNHLLSANTTETYKVRVEFKSDINASQLPSSADTLVFKFNVVYVQADSNAVDKPLPYVYTVNKYNSSTTTPKYNAVWLNQTFPASITQYQTPSEALAAIATASSKDLPFYLKHKIENGIVTESYVEFVVTPEMASANTGMVAGTYTLRGGIDESSLTDKPVFIQNAKTIYDAFGTNCSTNPYTTTISSAYFYCSVSGLRAYAGAYGIVYAYATGSSTCRVDDYGSSGCDW